MCRKTSRRVNAHKCAFISGLCFSLILSANVSLGATREQIIEAAKKEGEISFYSSANTDETNARVRAFEAKYPFIKVKLTRLSAEKILTKVPAELAAKRYAVDVIQAGAFYMYAFKKQNLLGYYLSPEDRFYEKEVKDQGYWTTSYYNPYVIGYNPRLVKVGALPKTYEDLLNPAWNGKLVMERQKIDWFAGMLQVLGKEKGLQYMKGLARQNMMLQTGHTLIAQLVSAGEAEIDINIPAAVVEQLRNKGAPIAWTAPGPIPGTLQAIGIPSNPPHPNSARLLVDFMLSTEGQRVIQSFYRWSARSDFDIPHPMAKGLKLRIVPVDPGLADKIDEYAKQMDDIFMK